jgi:hypothetical protein
MNQDLTKTKDMFKLAELNMKMLPILLSESKKAAPGVQAQLESQFEEHDTQIKDF